MEKGKIVAKLVDALIDFSAKQAIKYVSETETIKATRKRYKCGGNKTIDIVLTIGKPNSKERDFIKKCKKAGEPFPVKKIQLKYHKK